MFLSCLVFHNTKAGDKWLNESNSEQVQFVVPGLQLLLSLCLSWQLISMLTVLDLSVSLMC